MSELDFEEAKQIVDRVLFEKFGKHLTDVELIVLQGSWDNLTYEEIADKHRYSDYIKDVGRDLWNKLSKALGERVTKRNLKAPLERVRNNLQGKSAIHTQQQASPSEIEPPFPEGSVALGSPFYIERPPIESSCYKEIVKPGALIRIKAPQQMGKTSLLDRILAYAKSQSDRTVRLNLRQTDKSCLANLDLFLRWLCANISRQLKLEPMLDDYWDEEIGSKVSATAYFQARLLEQIDSNLVLAIDEIDRLFSYGDIAEDFFPLLRDWHEEANNQECWRKLRLVVAHSTEVYIELNIHQSPFNVGLPIKLPELTTEQVQDLARCHGLTFHSDEVRENNALRLRDLVGGHPYLVCLALYHLWHQDITLDKLLQDAATQGGIYGDHLRRHWEHLQQQPTLAAAMKQVVTTDTSVELEPRQAYQLESMGLVKLHGNEVMPSCQLYREYFKNNDGLRI